MSPARKVILGVTASDAHIVANHLIAHVLREAGYEVINLGACTPVSDFARAADEHPDCRALLIGSMNGHAYEDLEGLSEAKARGQIRCPVYLGGNLSVGAEKRADEHSRFAARGVDRVLGSIEEILPALERASVAKSAPAEGVAS